MLFCSDKRIGQQAGLKSPLVKCILLFNSFAYHDSSDYLTNTKRTGKMGKVVAVYVSV